MVAFSIFPSLISSLVLVASMSDTFDGGEYELYKHHGLSSIIGGVDDIILLHLVVNEHMHLTGLFHSINFITREGTYCVSVPKCRTCSSLPKTPTGQVQNIPNPSAKSCIMIPYTATYEYSCSHYVEAFEEHNTYNLTVFLTHMLRYFKFCVERVQTDNGSEFTNRFISEKGKPTLFEKYLAHYRIRHKLIKPYTPRHNGKKVERSHRKGNEHFYASHKFYSLKDFAVQPATHNRRYNNFPMRPLGWKSPREVMTSALCSL